MTSGTSGTSRISSDAEVNCEVWERTLRALALATTVLLTLGAIPASAASADATATVLTLTDPGVELSSSSTSTAMPVDRAELEAARLELVRAKSMLEVLRDHVSPSSVAYLSRLDELLGPVSERLSAADIRRLTLGLRQARNGLAYSEPLAILAAQYSGVRLREPALLERALQSQPDLLALVVEALDAMARTFGERTGIAVALEPFLDPEATEEVLRVYLVIESQLDLDATRELVDAFEEQWFADHCHRAGGRLSLSIDYV